MKEKINKNDIDAQVQLCLNEVTLTIVVKKDLSAEDGNFKNFGRFEISTGSLNNEECFWDGIEWFFKIGKKEFKEEYKQELKEKGFNWREVYKIIKILLKRARELNLITED